MSTETHTLSEGEQARRSHSILSGVKEAFLVWYALLAGIGAWTIHLVFFAAYVQFSCNVPGSTWLMHLITAVTLGMTALAMLFCLRMMRAAPEGSEESDEEGGRAQFIARLGLMIGALNFILIALEELYLVVLNSRRCG